MPEGLRTHRGEFDTERVVWIGEGSQIGYLPEIARNALGHGWV